MSRLLLTAAVLAVLVYTMVLGVRWLSPRIEQDIEGRVTTALAEQGLLWADVAVEGRDIVLSGTAPDEESKERAMNVAKRVFGVSKVEDKLVISGQEVAVVSVTTVSGTAPVSATTVAKVEKPSKKAVVAKDYELTITKDGEKIVLAGDVPDEASKAVLVQLATNRYDAENVDATGLTVVDGAPAGWRSAVGAVLMHISNMEEAKAIISGTEVMVSGSVLDKQYSDKMEQDVSQVLPKEYKAAFAVEVVTPTVAKVEPAAGAEETSTTETKPAAVACDSDIDLTKQTLMFGFDKAELTAAHKAKIVAVAKQMKGCADEHMVMAGYTDVTGSKLYNKWLSQQRAEAAMRGLMRQGVDKARLQAVGYGEQHPVADNNTKANRAKNRRVEFVSGTDLPYPVTANEEMVVKKADVKHGKATDKKPAVKHEKKAAKKVVSDTTVVSATEMSATTVVSETKATSETIAKPWWARKKVSETTVEVK